MRISLRHINAFARIAVVVGIILVVISFVVSPNRSAGRTVSRLLGLLTGSLGACVAHITETSRGFRRLYIAIAAILFVWLVVFMVLVGTIA